MLSAAPSTVVADDDMLADRMYLLLVGLAVVFGTLALRDYLRNARTLSPRAKVHVRMAVVFLAIGTYVYFSG